MKSFEKGIIVIFVVILIFLVYEKFHSKPKEISITTLQSKTNDNVMIEDEIPMIYSRRLCRNAVLNTIEDKEELRKALRKRFQFSLQVFHDIGELLQTNGRVDSSKWDECKYPECSMAKIRGWSGLNHDHSRWNILGKPIISCKIESFGKGDEEKRFCWREEKDCVVFSVGSRGEFGFEEDIVTKTNCMIHTFDCTGDFPVPSHLKNRVIAYKLCLGDPKYGTNFRTLQGLMRAANVKRVSFLKMDIEGFEYDVLTNIINNANEILETNKMDIFPDQIAFEIHYLTQFPQLPFFGRDLSPGEIFSFMEFLFIEGGYVLAERNDNQFCAHCSEILLVKVLC